MADIELSAALQELGVSLEKSNVFGTLNTSTDTETTLASTWYPIAGAFTNDPIENFTLNVDKIKYSGLETRIFKVIVSVSASSDTVNTNTYIGIGVNGNDPATRMQAGIVLKLAADKSSWMVMGEVILETDDEIQLMVLSDQAGAKITFSNVQANIFPTTHITE